MGLIGDRGHFNLSDCELSEAMHQSIGPHLWPARSSWFGWDDYRNHDEADPSDGR